MVAENLQNNIYFLEKVNILLNIITINYFKNSNIVFMVKLLMVAVTIFHFPLRICFPIARTHFCNAQILIQKIL